MSRNLKFLTFNDGVAVFHELLTDGTFPKCKLCFKYLTIGAKRNYEAAQADVQIDELIRTPLYRDISTQHVCSIGESWYRIGQIQHDMETLPPTSKFTMTRLSGEIGTVNLVSTESTHDEIGQIIESDMTQTEILCIAESVTRSEWSTAQQHDYQAEWMLDVFHADYHGERIAIFRGRRYVIYRTFCKGERMELYLGLRVGEMSEIT